MADSTSSYMHMQNREELTRLVRYLTSETGERLSLINLRLIGATWRNPAQPGVMRRNLARRSMPRRMGRISRSQISPQIVYARIRLAYRSVQRKSCDEQAGTARCTIFPFDAC